MSTEHRIAPDELDISRFCLAMEHSPIGTAVVGLDGCWLNVNAALRDFLGYTAEEFSALTFQDITYPEDLDADLALLNELLAGAVPSYQMEKRYVRKDGQVVWARLTVSMVRDAERRPSFFISHVQDIGASKAAEVERQRLSDRVGLAVKAANIGIWEWELENGALAWSPEMFALFRVEDPGTPLHVSFFERNVHEDDREALGRSIETGLINDVLNTEFRIRCLDGDVRIIKVLARLYRKPNGEPERFIGANWDVTETRNLALQAEAASRAKSQFLAVMSHEIRTPMNGILGMAQAMRGDELPQAQRERLGVITDCGESLLTILNDILDLSKVEAGKMELESTAFDLERLMRSVVAGYSAMAVDRGLNLTVDARTAVGTYQGDPTRLRQILSNLVSNALKFTAKGGVTMKARRTATGVRFEVSDTGLGMDAETLGRIFNPFAQEDASTTRRFGGTGLGLSIVRQLALLMGGDVAVASRPGSGSCFTVDLPLARLGDATFEVEAEAASDWSAATIRVLAAEDNPTNQLVLRTLLGQLGVQVTLVSNGEQAVEAWRRGHWDLVLMDVQMPVMDGFTATGRIRAIEAAEGRRATPILALTANAMGHHRVECRQAGMDGLVAKPLDVRLLAGAMEAVLGGDQAQQALAG